MTSCTLSQGSIRRTNKCRIENPGDQSGMDLWIVSPLKSLEGSVDCALSGKADRFLGRDSPLNYGGAQVEVWHGADGHPLFERRPAGVCYRS